jgi:hypothetical protein
MLLGIDEKENKEGSKLHSEISTVLNMRNIVF